MPDTWLERRWNEEKNERERAEASPNTRTPVVYESNHDKMIRVMGVFRLWMNDQVGLVPAVDTDNAVRQLKEILGDG